MPTEAEWEFAARGGDTSKPEWKYAYAGATQQSNSGVSAGLAYDATLKGCGWFGGVPNNSSDKTHEVGKKDRNLCELYDMSGNVWEWCWDWHNDTVTLNDSPDPTTSVVINPVGASSGYSRVKRGGSWSDYAGDCAVSYRSSNHPGTYGDSMGFRVVRSQ